MESRSHSQQQPSSSPMVFVRNDIFDHGIFPAPSKLTMMNLVQLFHNLKSLSDKHNQITLEKFSSCLQKSMEKISPTDAEVYFLFYKAINEPRIQFVSLLHADPKMQFAKKNNKGQLKADVCRLTLFLYVQMFSTSLRYQFEKSKDLSNSWKYRDGIGSRMQNQYGFSPMKSPRSKIT